MDDLISRQAAIKAIENLQDCYNGFSETYDKACIIGVLEEIPIAQVNTPTDTPTDLISRQAAIDAIHEDADWLAAQGSDWQTERMERDKSILKSLPSAQPEKCEDCGNFNKARLLIPQPERKKAKWVHGKEIAREYLAGRITYIEYKDYHCSECGYTVENIRWNVDSELVDRYCTACGAQMEVENDE